MEATMSIAVAEIPKERITFLKERLPSGTSETCIDRAVLITEGYKNASADPIIVSM